mmetsp:Transcript_15871/g.49125  ORF Transcript_15871/g.49125 Transcript_15871/m.49125 type:complete len:180 (-) Transcript_15871:44-583(-)
MALQTLVLALSLTHADGALSPRGRGLPVALNVRGGGRAPPPSPFDALRGRKIIPSWDGDLLDLTQTSCLGLLAGVATRVVAKVAEGLAKQALVSGVCLYAAQYSGFFKLDAANIKKAARSTLKTLKLKDELLEKLGLPDGADAADVKKKLADLAENQWEANEHRALGGLAGFAAAVFYL